MIDCHQNINNLKQTKKCHLFPCRKAFFDETTGKKHKAGTKIHAHQELCDTYKILAENGGDDFYNGTLAGLIVDDLKDLGSIITKDDLQSYE